MHKSTVLELFPTPVYTTHVPVELSSVIPFLNSRELNTNTDVMNYGLRSKDSYILDKPECSRLSSFILECVQDFANNTLLYDYTSYRFTQSWISLKEPGQHHITHLHPNSLISGCFYYGFSDKNTSAIKFHRMVAAFGVPTINPKTRLDKRPSNFATTEFSINFEPGLLLLFPSSLHHSVPLNETGYVRSSLAFNAVPTVGFGEEENLTELLF